MGKPRVNKYALTDKKKERWIKEGRGIGYLENYKPWFNVDDVPTLGDRVQILGIITKRYHQLLSQNEENSFYIYEYSLLPQKTISDISLESDKDDSSGMNDIQEQFPLLPVLETVEIANILGIKHPTDPITGALNVLTSDLLITKDGKKFARTIKHNFDELNLRTFEKFEIERIYWLRRYVEWGIIERRDIPIEIVKTIKIFRPYYHLSSFSTITNQKISGDYLIEIAEQLTNLFINNAAPFNEIAQKIDTEFGLLQGTGIAISYHLLATKVWTIDLSIPFKPYEILKIRV